MWRGVDQVPGWLGFPAGDTIYLAEREPDSLHGQVSPWPQTFTGYFRGTAVAFARMTGTPGMGVRNTRTWGTTPVLDRSSFVLPGVRVTGKDLLVTLRLSADGLRGYPPNVARRLPRVPERGRLRQPLHQPDRVRPEHTLLPGVALRRITGDPNQDPATNDGSPVVGSLSLPSRDALFLLKETFVP